MQKNKKQNRDVSFDTVSLAIYSNNHSNMVVTFQNVTFPPHVVIVPFISSHRAECLDIINYSLALKREIESTRALKSPQLEKKGPKLA